MPRHSAPVDLPAGACLIEPVTAGTTLLVRGGRVQVHEPLRWLAGQRLQPVQALNEGQVHRIDEAGWLRVEALHGGATVQWLATPAWHTRLWHAWATAMAARRRRLGSAAVDAA